MPIYNAPIYNFVSGNVKGSDVAFNKLTTGTNDIALGTGVMGLLTTGSFNIGVGNNSLAAITTGGSNVAVGSAVLQNLNTGFNNTCSGDSSSTSITTAHDNVAIGANSLVSLITGGANGGQCIAIGSGSLSNSTSDFNVAVGTSSGVNITTGTNNTTIGTGAGASSIFGGNPSLTTSNNCTFIGYLSTFGIADTGALNFATAIGANSQVSSAGTVVLGRTTDATVIGATAKDATGALLQVTGKLGLLSQTNGAGAQLATITNGPVAGNPAIWFQVYINGTLRNIPAW